MSVEIIHDTIVNRPVDAIVNAANSKLRAGSGVCGAIFEAAGYQELTRACLSIGFCQAGNAVITPGFDLQARFIIHAVGPVWRGGDNDEPNQLRRTYLAALELADEHGCESIAFPLISAGIYGMPAEIALECARQAFQEFSNERDMHIELVLPDKEPVKESLPQLDEIRSYIDDPSKKDLGDPNRHQLRDEGSEDVPCERDASSHTSEAIRADIAIAPHVHAVAAQNAETASSSKGIWHRFSQLFGRKSKEEQDVRETIDSKSATFLQTLLYMVDERNLSDSQVCHRANIDRKLLNKIRSDQDYSLSKHTTIQLAIALGLAREQADFLLCKAGYAFSPTSEEDLIVCYFIEHNDCDIFHINEALFYFDQPLLYN